MRITISSGHGRHVSGAVGLIKEFEESRRVVDRTAEFIRAGGGTATVFHDDVSKSQAANLAAITAFHNKQNRDVDCSVHFNAVAGTTSNAIGTECLYRTSQVLAARVSKAIADASGLKNRGAKKRTNLSFLNRVTAKPTVLAEICFVNSHADVNLYKKHFDAICRALAEALLNRSIGSPNPSPTPVPAQSSMPTIRMGAKGPAVGEMQRLLNAKSNAGLRVDQDFGPLTETWLRSFQSRHGLKVDGVCGPITWGRLQA